MLSINEKRFYAKVNVPVDPAACHNWTGARIGPYGAFNRYAFGDQYAHRIAYILANGPIADNMCVCHRCDNPLCCNVDHLFLGTQQDNVSDKTTKGRQAKGSRNSGAKLTEESALAIFSSKLLVRETAKLFGVSYGLVVEIRAKKLWKHIHKETQNEQLGK